MVETALSALRDVTLGRKIINFAISAYALTVIGAALFTSGGLRDGSVQPPVKGYEHIVRFIHWVGLSEGADWFEAKLVEPLESHSGTVVAAGFLLVIVAVTLFCLLRPPTEALPAQPAYGVVLGAALIVDFAGWNVWLVSIGAAVAVFLGLLVWGYKEDNGWDLERAGMPLIHALSPLLVLLGLLGIVISLIAVGPTSSPTEKEEVAR